MPVFAVGVAVVAIGIAAEVGTTLAIIAAVGATIGAVGAVTGSKELMIAGGVIGAIGGIGALASSAGIFGSAATLGEVAAGTTAAETASPFGAASGIDAEIGQWASYGSNAGATLSGAPSVSAAAPAVDNTLDVVNTVTGNVNTASEPLGSVTANAASPNVNPAVAADATPNATSTGEASATLENFGTPNTTPPGAAPGVAAPQAPGTADPSAVTNSVLNGNAGVVTGKVGPLNAESLINAPNSTGITMVRGATTIPSSVSAPLGSGSGSGIFSQLMDVIGKPGVGTLASGVVQAGMSFLSGATNGLTPAQIAALNAQAEANQAAANLSRMQQANMSGNLPVASRTPLVRSPPVTGAPAPVGLINTPPQGGPA